jgi:MFS family permease
VNQTASSAGEALAAVKRVAAATTLAVLGLALLYPVLAVRLHDLGASTAAIGAFSMLPFAMVALAAPVMPRLFARVGVGPAYRAGLALQLVTALGYLATDHFGTWCALAVVSGIGAAAEWTATEALIAHHAPPARRGHVTGLYQTVLGAALALGPLLPVLLGLDASGATTTAAALMAFALVIAAWPAVGRLQAAQPTARHASALWAARQQPTLVWAALVGGVFEAGLPSISAAWGAHQGLGLGAATSIAGVLGVGSFLLQYPTGRWTDRVPVQRLLGGAGIGLVVGSASLALSPWHAGWLWVSAALWGAMGGALYTLTMIRVAHAFAASSAVAGTAAVIGAYTVGAALGPLATGLLFQGAGATGAAVGLAVLASSVVFAGWRRGRGARLTPPPGA